MDSVFNEFKDRKNEIKIYIDFITISEHNDIIYKTINDNGIDKSELRRIFLANTYLLLYNLVESTIRNTIQEIYDHLKDNRITFDLLKSNIKKTIFKGLRVKSPTNITNQIRSITTDIISISFDPDNISNGNLDARKIRKIANNYCFPDSTPYLECKNGEKLLEIKNKRNDLSHGIISFSECGRDIAIGDLTNAFNETSSYLENIIENVRGYLDSQSYLHSQSA